MGDRAPKQSLTEMGATIAKYLRNLEPVFDVIEHTEADVRLELDYTSAMVDISYWLIAWWCEQAGHREWCDELLDEEGIPMYDDSVNLLADWFDTKLEALTP